MDPAQRQELNMLMHQLETAKELNKIMEINEKMSSLSNEFLIASQPFLDRLNNRNLTKIDPEEILPEDINDIKEVLNIFAAASEKTSQVMKVQNEMIMQWVKEMK